MASQAQCFYCFECLCASFEGRDPPQLRKVEQLWEEYQESLVLETKTPAGAPAEQPLEEEESATEDAEDTDEGGSLDEGEVGDEDADEDPDEQPSHAASTSASQPTLRPQLPSISRLQASIPISQSSSSSSPSTTPSTLSANSSNTALTTPASSTTSIAALPLSHNNRATYSSRLKSYPLFVTWNTHSRTSGHKSLRGCIGTFDPLPLASGLQTYALTSAFEDTRFSPIHSSLLPTLSCNITLLANFETCSHPLDWTVGTHGLRITFIYRGRRYGATYLPDVAVEQRWSQEETLESLMRKAGWDGGGSGGGVAAGVARRFLRGGRERSDATTGGGGSGGGHSKPWEDVGSFTVVRYTGLKAKASYGEWREWRIWVDERYGRMLG